MTLPDQCYAIKLEEASFELTKYTVCQYTSAEDFVFSLRGQWEPVRITPDLVALALRGVDDKGAVAEKLLVISGEDVDCYELERGLRLLTSRALAARDPAAGQSG